MQRIRDIGLFLLLALICVTCVAGTPAKRAAAPALPFTPAHAASYFAEATHDCRADHGKLWGVSLCGPMLFVDPAARHVIASQADADGRLKPAADGTFTGVLPPDQNIANTGVSWSGTRWIEMVWPLLPANPAKRRTLMAHESYHRVQAQIVPITESRSNAQLDTLYGRYTLLLECRALAAALEAPADNARRQAARDALLFRAARYHRFPEAQASEVALERNEGLAEYTGVMVGNATPAQRKKMALADLHELPDYPSFARSFAYATGPAYGLLLDRYRPGWRKQIMQSQQGLAAMLASALHLDLRDVPLDTFNARAAHYGSAALLAAETARENRYENEIAHYKSTLIDGPVLVLPLKNTRTQFDPRNVLALGKAGTIYPTLRVVDDWGVIDIHQGGLIAADRPQLIVAAPNGDTVMGTINGPGWTLDLKPGWRLVPATRKGGFTLRRETSDAVHKG